MLVEIKIPLFNYTLLDGKFHGEYRAYNRDGKMLLHNYWKNDKQEGECLNYIFENITDNI